METEILNSQYEQLLERGDLVQSCIKQLALYSGKAAGGDFYVYMLLDPREFSPYESYVQILEEAVRKAAFYIGKGRGDRIHTQQKARTQEPRYQRMQEITIAERGYLAIKVLEGVSEFIAFQLDGLLICSWPKDHLANRTLGSTCKIYKGEERREYSKKLQEWAMQSTLNKGLRHSAELPFLGSEGLIPQ